MIARKPKQPKAVWTTVRGPKGGMFKDNIQARKPVNRVSKRQRQRNAHYLAELRPWMEDLRSKGTVCPVANLMLGKILLVSENHHIRGRDGPLLLDKRWWLAVSAVGHKWIDANRKYAQKYGWLAGPGEWGKWEP